VTHLRRRTGAWPVLQYVVTARVNRDSRGAHLHARRAGAQREAVQRDRGRGPGRARGPRARAVRGRRGDQLDAGVAEPRHADVHGPQRAGVQGHGVVHRPRWAHGRQRCALLYASQGCGRGAQAPGCAGMREGPGALGENMPCAGACGLCLGYTRTRRNGQNEASAMYGPCLDITSIAALS